jgi:CDP-diacylglycerol--serine O-phosphatidyltransferase
MSIRQKGRMALPGAFTSGNLFFGFYAIISAFRLELVNASWFVIVGGILDFIDGKVAKFSKSYSRFGMELDSLADLVTFGVAPSVIMFTYFLRSRGEWSWLLVFGFLFAGALRLARYNVESPGPAKKFFTGLPIPVAGIFLVSFIPFSLTPLYARYFTGAGHERFLSVFIVLISILMISNVQYPSFPSLRRGGVKGMTAVLLLLAFWVGVFTIPRYIFFPLCFLYILFGLGRSILGGLWEKSAEKDRA